MDPSTVYVGIALLSFAAMGVLHKLGDHLGGDPVRVAALLFWFGAAVAAVKVATTGATWDGRQTTFAVALAIPFGVAAAGAVWAFQTGIRHGRIATSWLLLNLSVAIPAGLSATLFHEAVGVAKWAALALIVVAVVLMWLDRRPTDGAAEPATGADGGWFRLMMVAVVLNGLGDFGLRVLAADKLAGSFAPHYLVGWYLAGAVLTTMVAVRTGGWTTIPDAGVGLGLGACSVAAQLAVGAALAAGVPGIVTYPVSKAGGVFLVAAVGVVAFRERVGPLGVAGIALGLAAVVLLSLE